MRFLPLKVRPRSTHTVYDFGGIWHNLETPSGGLSLSGSAHHWYDERNLSHDAAPAMSLRKRSGVVTNIDGNEIPGENRIIATISEGGRPVILDDHGILYCGGHSVNTVGTNGVIYNWEFVYDEEPSERFEVAPRSGSTTDQNAYGGLVSSGTYDYEIYAFNADLDPTDTQWIHVDGGVPTVLASTVTTEGVSPNTTYVWTLTDYGITIRSTQVYTGLTFKMRRWVTTRYADDVYMVRMGSNVIILPAGIMVNAAKLEAGETVQVESLNAELALPGGAGKELTLNPCLLDGTIIAPVAGTTAPNDTTKIWADTTGDTTVMRQYVSAQSTWQAMQATYIRIDIGDMVGASDWINDEIRQWDAIKFELVRENIEVSDSSTTPFNFDEESRLGRELVYLMDSYQTVYKKYDDDGSPAEHYIVVQGILDETVHVTTVQSGSVKLVRKMPQMDFVVECANRLWGCYYGPNGEGEILNEIYACKLGDPRNWSCYMGLATDSWTASRGGRAPFTGAAVLDNSPLFFREESLEKVYPSSSGAHQIQTFDLDGVEPGAHRTLCVIDDRLYYKARRGVMVYTGTIPQLISRAFGDLVFTGITAARYKHRYLIVLKNAENEKVLGVYDIASGEWHMETEVWDPICVTYQDKLWYRKYFEATPVGVVPPVAAHYSYVQYDAWGGDDVEWYAESGIIGYELPEHRFISCIRIRLRLAYNSRLKAYISYDDGDWLEKLSLYESGPDAILRTKEINLYPLRCDHFRFALSGQGPFEIVSISYRMERSEGGH